MPREIITLQVGQCGNQLGCRFWDMALREHASCNPNALFDHALSSFFHNVDRRYTPPQELSVGAGNTPIRFLKARAVLIDMEEGVVNQLLKGSLAELFDSKQYITGASGSGNNWAQAHEVHGPQFSDAILEKVRGEAELCDSLQTFVMMHSIGGGTGSGVGSYILETLHDAYPEVYRFTQSIFPSADDDVITSPYNSLLSTMALTEHADCVLPLENQALLDIIRKNDAIGKKKQNSAAERWSPKVTKPFDEMNSIASNLLLHLTSSMRFEGPLNVDLNEITMNLVPYPRLHYLTSSMSPHLAVSVCEGTQQRAIKQVKSWLLQLFTDVFAREAQLMKVNPNDSTYLACALLMRGNSCTISDLQENVARMKSRLTMAHWNVEGFKVGLCNQAAVHSPCSLLCLANNTCIRSRFIGMKESFKQLYRRKVYVHHYTEYMDVSVFDTASNMMDDLIEEYETLETARTPEHLVRLQPIILTGD
ncbi:uncharacterized protein [Physcomitrium patens]|uniref:uncharacterized protein isoform X3 n=1 Tax=Physcomitrium patens TaxID=3218 RepID=UPI003CCCD9CF